MNYVDRSDEVREMYAAETDDVLASMVNGSWLDAQSFPLSSGLCLASSPRGSDYWSRRRRRGSRGWQPVSGSRWLVVARRWDR